MPSQPAELPSRGLHVYLAGLGLASLAVVGWLLLAGAGDGWSPVVVPVLALALVAGLCPVWTSTGRLRPQLLDASDVGLVVAVVLLPLPVALLAHLGAALVAVLWEFRRSPVRVLYNCAHVVLTAGATGALLWWWDPSAAWLPWAAAAACLLAEQLLAQPMLLVVGALAAGTRPQWRQLVRDRPAATVVVPVSTAALAGLVGAATQAAGDVLAWPAVAMLCALALVSRSRIGVQQEALKLLHAVRLLDASTTGRGTPPVLEALDAAVAEVGGVSGVRVVRADDDLPAGHLCEGVPSSAGSRLCLLVRRPVETAGVYGSREDAVLELLRTGARAYSLAETTLTLQHDLHHDGLTGLLNRSGFVARAEQELARARRSHQSLVVVYVDLDGFKAVNDTLGHDAGDRALQAVATELRELVRPHDVTARLSGDEFALLLLDLPTGEQGTGVVDRVRGRLATGWPAAPGSPVPLRGSVGTACFPDDADDLAGLLRRADARMYDRKRARRRGLRGPTAGRSG